MGIEENSCSNLRLVFVIYSIADVWICFVINIQAVKNSKITFLEGYLWDEGEPKEAFNEAINFSNKAAMSLSDKFCVDRHKKNFLDLVKNHGCVKLSKVIKLYLSINLEDLLTNDSKNVRW